LALRGTDGALAQLTPQEPGEAGEDDEQQHPAKRSSEWRGLQCRPLELIPPQHGAVVRGYFFWVSFSSASRSLASCSA
jgi:hypothetical protein